MKAKGARCKLQGGNMERFDFRVLVVDDVITVRAEIEQLLAEHGYQVSGVGSVREVLKALQGSAFNTVCLDIQLANDINIEDTFALFHGMFPDVDFPHEEVLRDFNLTSESWANGRYLLPLIKAVSPTTEVIMLSNAVGSPSLEEDYHYLRKHGALEVFQKYSEDIIFHSDPTNLKSLDSDLAPYLEKLFKDACRSV
jgi:CheY-like chemotaxis protein